MTENIQSPSVTETKETPPKLQPPGAGLPFTQRIFLKFWLGPFVSKRVPREQCRRTYEVFTHKIIHIVTNTPPEKRNIKMLIPPQPGLEDSSRYWSLNDTLEHLLIVSRGIEGIIVSLAGEKKPQGKVDTALVKPTKSDQDFLAEFQTYAPELMKRIDLKINQPGMSYDAQMLFEHPWFGGINLRQYYWLLGSHQGIHYKQVKEITKRLGE